MTRYSEDIADAICARIIAGEPLSKICGRERDPGFPCERTVYGWLAVDGHPFLRKYVRARELQPWALDELMLHEAIKVLRGEQDAKAFKAIAAHLQWKMAKMMPKKYGEKNQADPEQGARNAPPAVTINFTHDR